MKDNPHPVLLKRDEVASQIEQVYKAQIELLSEQVNYGSNLIVRAYETSEKKIPDMVVLHNFLRQAVSAIDGIQNSVSIGSASNGFILLRNLFEIGIYLKWILEKDTSERATLYYVWDARNKRIWLKRMLSGDPENEDFLKLLAKEPPLKFANVYSPEVLRDEIDRIGRILSQPTYSEINSKFDEVKRRNHDWYSPCVANLRQMAKNLGLEGRYAVFYSHYSKFSHGLALSSNIKINRGNLSITPIRSIYGLSSLLTQTFNLNFEIFHDVLKKFRPNERPVLYRKYINEWRQRSLGTPSEVEGEGDKIHFKPGVVPPISEEQMERAMSIDAPFLI